MRAYETSLEDRSPDAAPKPRCGAAALSSSPQAKAASARRRPRQTSATALAARGKRVALVDADVGLRNLDVVLGLESRVRHHLLDVLEEKVDLETALVRDKRSENLTCSPRRSRARKKTSTRRR